MPPHEGHCRNPNNSKDAVTMTWRGVLLCLVRAKPHGFLIVLHEWMFCYGMREANKKERGGKTHYGRASASSG